MNEIFQLNRFYYLFKKLLYEKKGHFIGAFVLIFAFVMFLYNSSGNIRDGHFYNQAESFSIGLVICGGIWISISLNYFSPNEEGYSYLTLPASYFEKWLTVVLTGVLFFIIYCIGFRIWDMAMTAYFKAHVDTHAYFYKKILPEIKVMSFNMEDNIYLSMPYLFFLNLTALVAVGGLYFNRLAWVKACLFAIGFFWVYIFIFNQAGVFLFSKEITSFFYIDGIRIDGEKYIIYDEPYRTFRTIFFYAILPILLWIIALVRMKEKEI